MGINENEKLEKQNFLLAGNSDFLKEEALEKIRGKSDLERFDAEENTLAEALNAARTSPLFSARRLILFRNVDRVETQKLQELFVYLKDPQKTSALILVTQDEKISPAWLDPFKGLCQVFLLNVPYENQLDSWIAQKVSEAGKRIEPQAAKLLKELVGAELRVLVSEIQKLILYAGDRAVITLDDVEHLVAQTIHYSGFILGDAVGAKDISMALSVLSRLLDEQKSIPEIIGLISWQIQRMLQGKDFRISNPFLARKFQQHLTHWKASELREAAVSLLEVDVAIKTGQLPARLAMEEWLAATLTRQVSSSSGISYGQRR